MLNPCGIYICILCISGTGGSFLTRAFPLILAATVFASCTTSYCVVATATLAQTNSSSSSSSSSSSNSNKNEHKGCALEVTVGGQTVRLEAYGAHAVRVRAIPATGGYVFRDDTVSALVQPADGVVAVGRCRKTEHSQGQMHRQEQKQEQQTLTNGNLRATVGDNGLLTFTRVSDNRVLVREISPRTMTPLSFASPSQKHQKARYPPLFSLDMALSVAPGAGIYGLGQHKTGQLNNVGAGRLALGPKNTEVLMPVAHSSAGHSFLFNLPALGYVEYNRTGGFWHAEAALQADFWVATTQDSPPHATSPWLQRFASYANVTGHAPVMPDWAAGFWQSKNRYHNQTQLVSVVDQFRARSLPVSLAIIDYYTWSPGPLGDDTLPSVCWPDPGGMVKELAEAGVETMLSPYMHAVQPASKRFAHALDEGLLVRSAQKNGELVKGYDGAYIYDLFTPEARSYAWSGVHDGYVAPYNLRHFWLDCDEPCGVDDAHNMVFNNGTWPASLVAGAYPHMLYRAVYEGSAGNSVTLGRSAWAGSQRYGAAVWSGDTSSTFDSLNQQFRAGLNMVMSGIVYWTSDIGGYNGGNISDPLWRQLAVRWFQWGAFCPLFRNHGRRSGGPPEGDNTVCGRTGGSNEPWNFGDEAESAIARVMALREQLRPYIVAQYAEAARTGAPVMRPLFVDFWDDATAQRIDDQLMFGPDYLVAPQLKQGATSRTVYLPPLPVGQAWSNVFTGIVYPNSNSSSSSSSSSIGTVAVGGINVTVDTPLFDGTFPVFQRVRNTPYPPPPTPPPPPVQPKCVTAATTAACSSVNMTASLDAGSQHRDLLSTPISSDVACCSACAKQPNCTVFVRGLQKGVDTCFLLADAPAVTAKVGRSYGCMRR